MKTIFSTRYVRAGSIGAALILGACIPSVHPFYTKKDLVTDPRILGTWQYEGELWTFTPARDGGMKLEIEHIENKRHGLFAAYLFKLEEHLFLDIAIQEIELPTQVDLVAASLIAGHLIIRVRALEPRLEMSFCDYKWLRDHLTANPSALACKLASSNERADFGHALTAETRALQAFVLAHLADGELFQPRDPNGAFERVPAGATPASSRRAERRDSTAQRWPRSF